MGKTTEVAAFWACDKTKTVLPSEVAQGVYMQKAPSLRAIKMLHLLIAKAGGRMADNIRHEIRLSDINQVDGMVRHDCKMITLTFGELIGATLIHADKEKKRVSIGGVLDEVRIDCSEERATGDLLLRWSFCEAFRDMLRNSNHWVILDWKTVFHFGSKHSLLLFQHIASLQALKNKGRKRFTVLELKALMGIPKGTLSSFSDLKKQAIQPAVAEINSDLARLHLTVSFHEFSRKATEIEIAWEPKAFPAIGGGDHGSLTRKF